MAEAVARDQQPDRAVQEAAHLAGRGLAAVAAAGERAGGAGDTSLEVVGR